MQEQLLIHEFPNRVRQILGNRQEPAIRHGLLPQCRNMGLAGEFVGHPALRGAYCRADPEGLCLPSSRSLVHEIVRFLSFEFSMGLRESRQSVHEGNPTSVFFRYEYVMPSFSGVIPPVVSPMSAPDQIDGPAVGRIVEHLISGGVSGLFVLGTTGEGPSLTYQMRYEMVELTCEAAAGRVPVFVGVTDTCLAESMALAEHAARCQAAAIVAAAPFYFDVPQRALETWFEALATASPLPLMLYNMPSCVGVVLESVLVDSLSHHPNIIGIKDSGGDMAYFESLCERHRKRSDFVIFMGPEERLAEAVTLGAAGGVCGGANLLPLVYTSLYQAAIDGDQGTITQCKDVIRRVFESVYYDDDRRMKLIPGLKLAMEVLGLCSSVVAPPLSLVTDQHASRIRSALPQLLETSRL
jgi:dihydrodipicolinate synthase/N-acetylneuraminate lyase